MRMTGSIIAFLFSNLYLVLFAVAVCTAAGKLRRYRREGIAFDAAYVAWGEQLFYSVGIVFVYYGFLHANFGEYVAPAIGWRPSPFEYELGWVEIPLGVVAMMALWRGYEFRLAATIVSATFLLACAAQHIHEMLCCGNYAPSNAGPILWFYDIFVPVLLIALALLSRKPRRDAPIARVHMAR
jgi:hypothetical protein